MPLSVLAAMTMTPLAVLAGGLVSRRWGPAAAGWLAALPIVTGPVLLVIALERGEAFVTEAAAAATVGLLGLSTFVGTYVEAAVRGHAWWRALTWGWLVYAVPTSVLMRVEVPVPLGVGIAMLTILVARATLGRVAPQGEPPPATSVPGLPEVLLHAAAGALMVGLLSFMGARLGARPGGLLSSFPAMASVVLPLVHRQSGSHGTVRFAGAFFARLPALAVFTSVIGLGASIEGVLRIFSAGLVLALLAHLAPRGPTR